MTVRPSRLQVHPRQEEDDALSQLHPDGRGNLVVPALPEVEETSLLDSQSVDGGLLYRLVDILELPGSCLWGRL